VGGEWGGGWGVWFFPKRGEKKGGTLDAKAKGGNKRIQKPPPNTREKTDWQGLTSPRCALAGQKGKRTCFMELEGKRGEAKKGAPLSQREFSLERKESRKPGRRTEGPIPHSCFLLQKQT